MNVIRCDDVINEICSIIAPNSDSDLLKDVHSCVEPPISRPRNASDPEPYETVMCQDGIDRRNLRLFSPGAEFTQCMRLKTTSFAAYVTEAEFHIVQ